MLCFYIVIYTVLFIWLGFGLAIALPVTFNDWYFFPYICTLVGLYVIGANLIINSDL